MRIRFVLLWLSMIASLNVLGQGLTGYIKINQGATIVNHPEGKVNISIYSRGATHMRISRDESFRGAVWEAYSSEKRNFSLIGRGGEDGLKTIYAVFKNANGNVSEVVSAQVELDRLPPQNPMILINGGMPYTNKKNRMVKVLLQAEEATEMRVATRPDFFGAVWVPYRSSIDNFRLVGEEGKKEIFAQYRDGAKNTTEVVTASIMLDFTPPLEVKLTINDGARFAKSPMVKLGIHAKGASQMQIRGGEGWVEYKESLDWQMSGGDGEKVVYARFMDEAGNLSAVAKGRIFIDTTPPRFGKIVINKGKRYIEHFARQQVQIFIQGASQMLVSNHEDFRGATWMSYKPLLPTWTFTEGDGKKFFYAKFKDAAGNESQVFKSSVILDSTPPQNAKIKIEAENSVYDTLNKVNIIRSESNLVDLKLNADDAYFMMVSNVNTFYGATWMPYKKEVKDWKLEKAKDGVRTVYVKFMDKARNVSDVVKDRVVVDSEAPIDCQVSIENNKQFAIDKDKKVVLKLFARKADYMMISNFPTFDNAQWEPYNTFKKWILEGDDGVKTVFVKFRDLAGNVAEPVSDNIVLDRQAPRIPSIVINKGAKSTNNPDKVVIVKVKAEEAVKMKISNNPKFVGAPWKGYSAYNIPWQLSGGDGLKPIFVMFQDEAGNNTRILSDSILLDRKPPYQGRIAINEKDKLSNNSKVTLELFAENAEQMMLSSRFDFKDAEWEPYKTKREWTFKGGDGVKFAYVKFRDKIGNVSRPVYDKIGVDTQAPKGGTITINRMERYCTDIDAKVILRLSAQGATEMLISNNDKFQNAEWQKFNHTVYDYYLDSEGDGEKKVYAKFRDDAKNETKDEVIASVVLDRQPPVNESIQINNGEEFMSDPSGAVSLAIFVEGAKEMMVSNDRFFKSHTKWQPYKEELSWVMKHSKDGPKYVYAKFRDDAGNESDIAEGKIILDTTPPIPQYLKINEGVTAVDNARVKLSIKARGGVEYMKISNSPRFDDGAIWQAYQESVEWTLPGGAGLKKVYVKFKDKAQNESGSKWAETTLYEGK